MAGLEIAAERVGEHWRHARHLRCFRRVRFFRHVRGSFQERLRPPACRTGRSPWRRPIRDNVLRLNAAVNH